LQQLAPIPFQIAQIGLHRATLDQPEAVGDEAQQVHVVADQDDGTGIGCKRLDQCLAAFDVEVVGRFVEDQQMWRVDGGQQQGQARLLAAGQAGDDGVGLIRAQAEARKAGAQARLRMMCWSGVSSMCSSST
jgi:hypothetical protein